MKRFRWAVVWLAQIIIMAICGMLVALSDWFGQVVYILCAYAVMPLLGLFGAYFATRKGLLNYVAWIAPPVMMSVCHWLYWGYLPSPAPVFICAFVSLVGAAAGEVKNQQREKKHG